MTVWEIILIGVALAMDAFALTIANCTTYKNSLTRKKEWSMPAAFALFQFLMPVIGYYIGSALSGSLKSVSKFVTAAIFFALALKIVIDNLKEAKSGKGDRAETGKAADKTAAFTFGVLIAQAIATSIDALLIGVTFAVSLDFSVFLAALIIGAVTFAIVVAALYIGKSLGKILGRYAQWAGAVILLILAVKNLAEGITG